MKQKLLIVFIGLTLIAPNFSRAFLPPDTDDPALNVSLDATCNASSKISWLAWLKIVCEVRKVMSYINNLKIIGALKTVVNVLGYVPHQFPFGGHITSTERACTFDFKAWVWIVNPACYLPYGQGVCAAYPIIPIPLPIPIPLGGRAIEVGPPVPTPGKVIVFPWISNVYRNHNEDRIGPWALGIGFTPFPLKDINNAIKDITIWIPPTITGKCPGWEIRPVGTVCITDFKLDCKASGEKDQSGEDIYKVILKLGTSN